MKALWATIEPDSAINITWLSIAELSNSLEERNAHSAHQLICVVLDNDQKPETIEALAKQAGPVPLLALLQGQSLSHALRAVRQGAWDFLTLPTHNDRLAQLLRAARRLQQQTAQLDAVREGGVAQDRILDMPASLPQSVAHSPSGHATDRDNSNEPVSKGYDPSGNDLLPDFCKPFWQQERTIIESTIQHFHGNVSRAAAALEISPSTIYRKRQSWDERLADA